MRAVIGWPFWFCSQRKWVLAEAPQNTPDLVLPVSALPSDSPRNAATHATKCFFCTRTFILAGAELAVGITLLAVCTLLFLCDFV